MFMQQNCVSVSVCVCRIERRKKLNREYPRNSQKKKTMPTLYNALD